MPPRTIAIGDVHGCAPALKALLDQIRPRPDDTIVTLGDYVNRGPDSRGVLDRLIALEQECRLVPILGNHDHVLLVALDGDHEAFGDLLDMGGKATLESYGATRSTEADLKRIPAAHHDFLKRCRESYETDTHLFVHAQYDPDLPIDEQFGDALRWYSLRNRQPGPHASGKRAIVGHTSQKDGEILDLGHIVCIDTFCYGGGWLTALDVDTGEVWQVDRLGRPRPEGK